jgi:hypothetical protein
VKGFIMVKVLLSGIFAAGLIFSNTSHAEVYVIDSNDALQRFDASQIADFDEIYFLPGEYTLTRPIKIDSSYVTIASRTNKDSLGTYCPVLWKTGAFAAIRLNGDNNKVTCITVEGNGYGQSGIAVYGSNNVLNKITSRNNGGAGILLHGNGPIGDGSCKRNVIKQASISNNGGVGLSQFNCQGDRIFNSEFRDNQLEGITIDVGSHNTSVDHSTIQFNKGGVAGVGIDDSNNVKLLHNQIVGNLEGGVRTQNNAGPSKGLLISCSSFNNPEYDVWLRNNTCEGDSLSECEMWSNITPITAMHNSPNASFLYNDFSGKGIKVDRPSDLQRNKSNSAPNAQSYCNAN